MSDHPATLLLFVWTRVFGLCPDRCHRSGTVCFDALCFSPAALTDPNANAAQQAMLQQQLSVLAYSPYGDSPLFRNPLSDPKKKEEVRVLKEKWLETV